MKSIITSLFLVAVSLTTGCRMLPTQVYFGQRMPDNEVALLVMPAREYAVSLQLFSVDKKCLEEYPNREESFTQQLMGIYYDKNKFHLLPGKHILEFNSAFWVSKPVVVEFEKGKTYLVKYVTSEQRDSLFWWGSDDFFRANPHFIKHHISIWILREDSPDVHLGIVNNED